MARLAARGGANGAENEGGRRRTPHKARGDSSDAVRIRGLEGTRRGARPQRVEVCPDYSAVRPEEARAERPRSAQHQGACRRDCPRRKQPQSTGAHRQRAPRRAARTRAEGGGGAGQRRDRQGDGAMIPAIYKGRGITGALLYCMGQGNDKETGERLELVPGETTRALILG